MVHGWHSNSGIHGYLDRGGKVHGWSMDKSGETIGNIGSDSLTDMGLSMAAADNPRPLTLGLLHLPSHAVIFY